MCIGGSKARTCSQFQPAAKHMAMAVRHANIGCGLPASASSALWPSRFQRIPKESGASHAQSSIRLQRNVPPPSPTESPQARLVLLDFHPAFDRRRRLLSVQRGPLVRPGQAGACNAGFPPKHNAAPVTCLPRCISGTGPCPSSVGNHTPRAAGRTPDAACRALAGTSRSNSRRKRGGRLNTGYRTRKQVCVPAATDRRLPAYPDV